MANPKYKLDETVWLDDGSEGVIDAYYVRRGWEPVYEIVQAHCVTGGYPESRLSPSPLIPEDASIEELVAIAERPVNRPIRRVRLNHWEDRWQAVASGCGITAAGNTVEAALRALIARLGEAADD